MMLTKLKKANKETIGYQVILDYIWKEW